MNATDNIATDLFYKIRSRFRGLKLGSEDGTVTIKPNEARFFDFDYMEGETPIGHVSISLAEPNSMKVYFSTGITEAMDQQQKTNWYSFLKELRQFSKRRLMAFDTRDIAKDNLDERDFAFLSQNALQQKNNKDTDMTPPTNTVPVGESVMNESAMYGTKTMSFQKLMDTRLIIKHSQALVDDTQPGARTRHISALFVENQEGERFKYPFIHLAGARAMQRHVANGGLPYDDVGKSIISMSEQIAQLKSFNNYVVRNDLMNSDTNNIVERSTMALNSLREQIKALSKQGHYESYKANFQIQETQEVPEEVVEDYTEKFTIRNFKEDIKSVFPVLYRLMQENDNTVDYDDIVEMTSEEDIQEEVAPSTYDPLSQFEEWAMTLGERSAIQDPAQQDAAIDELNQLMGQHFPAGVDGTNAIESLAGIIDDPALHKQIEQASKEDPEVCVRPMVKQWLETNAPEVVSQVDFSDMQEESADDEDGAKKSDVPAALRKAKGDKDWKISTKDLEKEKERNISSSDWLKKQQVEGDKDKDDDNDPPFDADDEPMSDKDEYGNTVKHKARHLAKKGMRQAVDTRELAEFISSFYDKESGTFPKGPEGVATMVGKKFGERAEQAARKMVERMAPQQADPALQELGRIKQLAGVQTEQGAEPVDFDKDAVYKVFDWWAKYMDGVNAYGDPDYDKVMKLLNMGDIDEAVAELAYAYTDQNGGEIRNMDGYMDDLQGELEHAMGIGESMSENEGSREAEIQAWYEKYSRFKGYNGDSLPEGWVISMLDSGVMSDGFEANEVEKAEQALGAPESEWEGEQFDAAMKMMPITHGLTRDLAAIFGVDSVGEEEAEEVNKVLGFFESATPELEDIKRLSGISQGLGF
jgi:hypothetical protein